MTCWEILQIEKTKDIRVIKHAYAELTKTYHPEENPEKFKEIQTAYKQATAYAKERLSNSIFVEKREQKKVVLKKETPSAISKKKAENIIKETPSVISKKKTENIIKETPSVISKKKTENIIKETIEEIETEEKYFESLFKDREKEKIEKSLEYGNEFKNKIQYLIRFNRSEDIELWRFTLLRRQEFKWALYDVSFVELLFMLLYHHTLSSEILFEIYFYFLKNKKREDWNKADNNLNDYLERQFI